MRHGGDLDEATRIFGSPPQGWLDLSTGINPRPYPSAGDRHFRNLLHRLPSSAQLNELLTAARWAYAVPETMAILAAPGTEILIRALPDLVDSAVTLIRTSYRSYGEMWPEASVTQGPDLAPIMEQAESTVIVVNPNNPDGRILERAAIVQLVRSRAAGRLVIMDEAYADSTPYASVVPLLRPQDRVLVLRSFGKFYGLPGLRLGFAIGSPALIERLADRLGDWPVSGPAQAIGSEALADEEWRRETRHWLGNQAQALDAVLLGGRLRLTGGCPLFRTAEAADAPAVQERLARSGIWTRVFEDWPGLIRFGLPPDRAGLDRLAEALAGH
jgi:cobalamin biosynthetic protein CobC